MEDVQRNEEIAALAAKFEALKALLEARTKKGGKRRSKHVGYKLLKTRIDWAETPQMWTVVDVLKAIGADKAAIPIAAVEAAMERNEVLFDITGEKQTATRIWRYYRKELLDHGVIEEVKQQVAVVVA